jgi:hypothetical protein
VEEGAIIRNCRWIRRMGVRCKVGIIDLSDISIPIEDTEIKNCLSNAKFYFWPEKCQMHVGKTSKKGD